MSKKAFTLIELLIVVAIIAILAAIAVPNFLESQVRAKVSKAKNDLRTIALAFENYCVDHNKYPYDQDNRLGRVGEWGNYCTLTTPLSYLTAIPRDPFIKPGDPREEDACYEFWGRWRDQNASWQASSTKWVIYTYGPDLTDQDISQYQDERAHHRAYDPTNGTKSLGDIMRSNTRVLPE
jgi:type II secretion system protein G